MPIPFYEIPKRALDRYRTGGITSLGYFTQLYIKNLLEIPPTYVRHLHYKVKWGNSSPKPYQILRIHPNEISYIRIPPYRISHITRGTHIAGGNWDVRLHDEKYATISQLQHELKKPHLAKYSNYGLYTAIRDHLTEKAKWEDSEYFVAKRKEGISRSSLISEIKETEKLYESIKSKGYKTQKELNEIKKEKGPSEYDEIRVDICRNGRIVLDDCRHRLAIAKILNLDEIPVRVYLRHTKWQEIRYEVARTGNLNNVKNLPDKILYHPDLEDVRNSVQTKDQIFRK